MAKRKRANNKITNERRIKEGRGLGFLANYKPWIKIQDIASKGTSTRIKGFKTKRVHHLLSSLELDCFYCLDWCEEVYDIREQYPLDINETLAIADELVIRHPRVPVTQNDVILTTDILVTLHNPINFRDVAITIKYTKDLDNPRTIEKLEIERNYWQRRDIDWLIISENQINTSLVRNIKWIHSFFSLESFLLDINAAQITITAEYLFHIIRQNNVPLRNACTTTDVHFSYTPGTALLLVRHLIATRQIIIDMTIPIQPTSPLPVISLNLQEVSE